MRVVVFSRGGHCWRPWRWFVEYADLPFIGRYLVFGPVVIQLKKYQGRPLKSRAA